LETSHRIDLTPEQVRSLESHGLLQESGRQLLAYQQRLALEHRGVLLTPEMVEKEKRDRGWADATD
jgi:hypothetical protein